jgi:signal transduction histidine kinase
MICSCSPASGPGCWSCGTTRSTCSTWPRRGPPALGLPVHIAGDLAVVRGRRPLRQVIANPLLHNSAAAGASTVRVQIAPNRAFAVLEVADDGGFPVALLNSVFQRFVRGDRTRTPRGSGAGLGLPTVRAITKVTSTAAAHNPRSPLMIRSQLGPIRAGGTGGRGTRVGSGS